MQAHAAHTWCTNTAVAPVLCTMIMICVCVCVCCMRQNGFTALHVACKKSRIPVIELLLRYGAHVECTTEVCQRHWLSASLITTQYSVLAALMSSRVSYCIQKVAAHDTLNSFSYCWQDFVIIGCFVSTALLIGFWALTGFFSIT